MVSTEKKIEMFILNGNWSMAIRTAVKEDCSEECQRKIIDSLISKGLISFCEKSGEKYYGCSFSSLSIHLFFRICNSLRRDRFKHSLPDRMFFGRVEKGGIIDVVITKEFKLFLRYDEAIVVPFAF